jgi:hypothetical protein
LHPAAQRLLGRVGYLGEPNRELRPRLAGPLLAGPQGEAFGRLAGDYLRVLDDLEWGIGAGETPPQSDPLSDWLETYRQEPGEAAFAAALSRWQADPSLPWLLAALVHLPSNHAEAPVLLAAAAQIPADSPAFVTALYYRLRHLLEAGRPQEAQGLLEAIPPAERLGPSARNLFAALRGALAGSFDAFAALAARPAVVLIPDLYGGQEPGAADWCRMAGVPPPPAVVADGEESPKALELGQPQVRFDPFTLGVLNDHLPLALLDRLSQRPELPAPLRDELRRVVWVRAVLLGEEGIARQQAQALQREQPELAAGLGDYLQARGEQARAFAAARLMLRLPGLSPYLGGGLGRGHVGLWGERRPTPLGQIDNYRENWWCAGRVALEEWQTMNPEESRAYPPPSFPVFLSEAERHAAEQQAARLRGLGTAPNYLAGQVIAWAEAHPNDASMAETLHLTVRATRYGCADEATSPLSKRAFQLLHQRFPKGEWAKKTPYWF